MINKYISYRKKENVNPFMHIKQKTNGELCFRFLNVTEERFDVHYTRHNKEFHSRNFYKGIEEEKKKTSIKKTIPVNELSSLERIKALVITDFTASRKTTEKIRDFKNFMEIDSSLYPKGLINMVIYLNPNVPIDKILKIAKPVQYFQDDDFSPSLLILCFRHSVNFLRIGEVDLI